MDGGYNPFTTRRNYFEFAYWYKKENIDIYNLDKFSYEKKPDGCFNFKIISNLNDTDLELNNMILADQEQFTIETMDNIDGLKNDDKIEIVDGIGMLEGMYFVENIQKRLITKTSSKVKDFSYISVISIRR